MTDFNEILNKSGMNLKRFSDYFKIPYKTLQHWKAGDRMPPEYLMDLIEYKLEKEGLIKED